MSRRSTENDGSARAAWEDDAVLLGHDDVSDFNEGNILPQTPETLVKIRKWLQSTSYDGEDSEFAKHLASHLDGTGRWLLDSSAYKEWHSSKEHGLLWIRGIPGSGKSVLAATLVDQLRQEGVPVLYFFFRQIIDANHSPVAALRDWLDEILVFSPPLQLILRKYVDTGCSLESLSTTDFWRHLRTALSHLPRAYLVVDALDEMDRGESTQAFLLSLAELGQWRPSQFKMIITSRPVQYVEGPLRLAKALHLRLQEQLVDVDIAAYVQHRLSKSAIQSKHQKLIKDAVPGRANGLFLYAKLAMDAFMQPGADIQHVLQDLPADLNVMYTDILREHSRRTNIPDKIQLLVMQFVTHATRPLRLLELAQMINVTQYPEEKRDLKATKDLVRSACGSLLEILPNEVVCVVHHSLTEFLTGATRDMAPHDYPVLEFGPTHNCLALICLSYIQSSSLAEFEPNSKSSFNQSSYGFGRLSTPTQYAGSNWFVHVRKAASAGVEQTEVNSILDTLFTGNNLAYLAVLSNQPGLNRNTTPLFAAVALGLEEYTRKLLDHPGIRLNREEGMEVSPLIHATQKGYVEMVTLLLRYGADPMERDGEPFSGRTPLHHAAANNHPKIVTLLLKAGADPFVLTARNDQSEVGGSTEYPALQSACSSGYVEAVTAFLPFLKTAKAVNTALSWAAESSQQDVVELFVKHPLVQVNAKIGQKSPLMSACGYRNVRSVRCLLAAGADPNQQYDTPWSFPSSQMDRGHTALHCWAARTKYLGHPSDLNQDLDVEATEECFRLLTGAGARIHQRDPEGNTPLQVAYDVVTVRLLVDAGADPNAVNDCGETLLHHCRDRAIVQFLLKEAKASNNLKTLSNPPLLTFLENNNVVNALLLLEFGADATVVDREGNGAFHYAVGIQKPYQGDDHRQRLIEALHTAGANLNLKNKTGQTPLHQFGCGPRGYGNGDIDAIVFPAVVAAGADIEARDNEGQTPLFMKVKHGYFTDDKRIAICERMTAAGALLNTRDYKGRNLLHAAADENQTRVLTWLVNHGVDPKATDHDGNTVFHDVIFRANRYPYGQSSRSFDTLDGLISIGVDPLQPNHAGRTPLHSVSATRPCIEGAHDGRTTAFDYVLALHKDVNRADNAGVTALHLAATFSEYQTKRLLEAGAHPSMATHEGMTAFHLAARSRQPNIIGLLLDSLVVRAKPEGMKLILDTEANYRKTALYYACASGRVESMKLLLEAGASANGDYFGMAMNGCSTFEAEEANWPRLEADDKWSPDAGSVTVDGTHRTKLGQEGRYPTSRLDEILDILVSHPPFIEDHIDRAVIHAAGSGSDYTVDCLLRIRAGLGQKKSFKFSHESFACLTRREAVRRAYESGAPDGVSPQSWRGHSASELDFLMSIREYGLARDRLAKEDCLKIQKDGGTDLHELVGGGFASLLAQTLNPKLLAQLEDAKWREEMTNNGSRALESLLVAACQREMPNMDVITILVEQFKVNLDNQNQQPNNYNHYSYHVSSVSALHVLAGGSHWWQAAQAIPYLVKHGANMETRDDKGLTPLNYALGMLAGNLGFNRRAIETLVQLGADINSVDNGGVSCVARATSDKEILKLLLGCGATVEQKGLFAAIKKENFDALEVVLLGGANPN